MALTLEFPVISSNLKAGYGAYGTADPYNSAALNNGALNPVGSLYFQPSPSMGGNTILSSQVGYASGLWLKYVLFKSTANPAMVAGPAPVYYTDETFTTVSGVFTEGLPAATGNTNSVAGWMLPNTGAVAGVGVGAAVTAAILNNGGNGSYIWMAVQGFVPSAYLAAGAQGNAVSGAAGNWTVAVASAYGQKVAAYVWGAVAANIGDIQAACPLM